MSRSKLKSYQKNIFPSSSKEIKNQNDLIHYLQVCLFSDTLNNNDYRELVFKIFVKKDFFNNEDICQLT